MGKHLQLVAACGGRILRDHVSALRTRVVRQVRPHRVLRIVRRQDPERAPLGDAGHRHQCHLGRVERERQRHAVEVAAGDDLGFASLHEEERVVGDAAELALHHAACPADAIDRGAQHLRAAAERVRVLHARVVLLVGLEHFASRELLQDRCRHGLLPGLVARGVDARIQERVRGAARIDGERGGAHGGAEQGVRIVERQRADRAHVVRAVDERQTFLRMERLGPEVHGAERIARRHPLSAEVRLAFAEEPERQVRERSQVAGGAHRTARRHHGVHAGIQHGDDQFHQLRPHRAVCAREACRQDHHHAADHFLLCRITDTGGVAPHEVHLQRVEVGIGHAHPRQRTEPGVDPVHGFARTHPALQRSPRGGDRRACLRHEAHGAPVAGHLGHVVDGER